MARLWGDTDIYTWTAVYFLLQPRGYRIHSLFFYTIPFIFQSTLHAQDCNGCCGDRVGHIDCHFLCYLYQEKTWWVSAAVINYRPWGNDMYKPIYVLYVSFDLDVDILSLCKIDRNSFFWVLLKMTQHKFRLWLGAVRKYMMTSSNENIFRVTGHLCGEFTGPQWILRTKGQWRGALMFSLICAWINRWVNNREAGDLRRYRPHYYVIVMTWSSGDLHIQSHVASSGLYMLHPLQ